MGGSYCALLTARYSLCAIAAHFLLLLLGTR